MQTTTYTIALDKSWIRCEVCGMTSHNQHDVYHRYCSNCKMHHEDAWLQLDQQMQLHLFGD